MMNIVVLGATGQLGWELQKFFSSSDNIHPVSSKNLDVFHTENFASFLRHLKPDVVINALAYTAVDQAQQDKTAAFYLNAEILKILAEELPRWKGCLIHFSTDYVFDGHKRIPYTEEDVCAPLNVYGHSKRAGELNLLNSVVAFLVFRVSWLYSVRRKNFLRTILKLLQEKEEFQVVCDQMGSPTPAWAVAGAVAHIVQQGRDDLFAFVQKHRGIYHMACEGVTNWHGFALKIQEQDRLNHQHRCQKIHSILTQQYPTPAQRPLYSCFNLDKLRTVFGVIMPSWEQALYLTLG